MPSKKQKPRTSIRRALSLQFLQKAVSLVFSFGSVILISRLLTPSEIGVFSVAAGLLALVHMLRDFGVSEFLVQEDVLTPKLVNTVFTINLVIAWVLAVALLAGSVPIGRFYGNPGVAQVLQVMSIIFFLLPFGTTTHALLARELEFGKLVKINLAGDVTRSCTKIALAYAGFSYMSLAWGAVAGIVVTILGFMFWGWNYRARGLSLARWRDVVHFGSSRTVADVASQLGDQSANLVIGKMLGMADTGLFSRGYGVVNMYRANILGAIASVAFPAYAREHRETATAPQLYLKSLVYITGISWPFFACGILLARPIIIILFGDQWEAAIPLMQWLCGAALVGTLIYQCNRFLVAVGRVHAVTRVEVEYQFARIGITIAAAFWSVAAVAASQILVYVLATALYYHATRFYPVLAVRNVAKALVPSLLVTIATCVVPAVVIAWPGLVQQHMLPASLLAFVGGCIGWLVGVSVVHHPLLGEMQAILTRLRLQLGGNHA